MELYREYEFEGKEIERITKQQTKIRENLQLFEHRKNENVLVQEELKLLAEGDVVYKLIGPILVKQEHEDAKVQVNSRVELISKEISKIDKAYKENEAKIDSKRAKMQDIQAKLITLTKQIQQMQEQQQQNQ